MLMSAFSFLWSGNSRNYQRGGFLYLFSGRHDVLFVLSREFLDQSNDVLRVYKLIILRYNNTLWVMQDMYCVDIII